PLVDIDSDHARALGRHPFSAGQPDAAASAGDDGHPVLQALHCPSYSVAMNTFLVSVNASSASGPSSRPSPDCLNPPNGVQYRTDECEFTDRLPVSTARATLIARPMLPVQIDPDSPYGVSLAISIASASSLNGVTVTTGPNISSVNAGEPVSAGASTVGGYQK